MTEWRQSESQKTEWRQSESQRTFMSMLLCIKDVITVWPLFNLHLTCCMGRKETEVETNWQTEQEKRDSKRGWQKTAWKQNEPQKIEWRQSEPHRTFTSMVPRIQDLITLWPFFIQCVTCCWLLPLGVTAMSHCVRRGVRIRPHTTGHTVTAANTALTQILQAQALLELHQCCGFMDGW